MGRPWGRRIFSPLLVLFRYAFVPEFLVVVLCELVHYRLSLDDALQSMLEGLLAGLGEAVDPPDLAGLPRAPDRGEEASLLHPVQYGVYGARLEASQLDVSSGLHGLYELVAVHRPLVEHPQEEELYPAPLREGAVVGRTTPRSAMHVGTIHT